MAPRQFTVAEVKQHNSKDDLWLIIHDKVYDVTKFIHEHPGGDEVLIEKAGKNATRDFDDADHSSSAIEQMANFYLGDIVDAERTEKKQPDSKPKPSGASNCNFCVYGLSVAAVALGVIILYKGYVLARSCSN